MTSAASFFINLYPLHNLFNHITSGCTCYKTIGIAQFGTYERYQSKPNGALRTANSNPLTQNGVRNAVWNDEWNGEWKIVSRFPHSWRHKFAGEGSTSFSALLKHFVVHPSKAAVRPQNSTGVAIPLIHLSTKIMCASQY